MFCVACKPLCAPGIKRFDFRPPQSWHIGLDYHAQLGLQIGQIAIAFRKLLQHCLIEYQRRAWFDGTDFVALVNWLAQDDPPIAISALKEIIEAPVACRIAQDPVDSTALGYRHLGLRDGPVADYIEMATAQRMIDHRAICKGLS